MIGAVIHVVWLSSILLNLAWASPQGNPVSTPTTAVCTRQSQVEKIGGCLYYFSTEEKTWDEAQAACEALGLNSNMATSLAEAGTVKSCDLQELMDAVIQKGNGVWFGARKTAAASDWVWKGTPSKTLSLSSNLWRGDEPMETGMCLKAHLYGIPRSVTAKRVYFKSRLCTDENYFVCQAWDHMELK